MKHTEEVPCQKCQGRGEVQGDDADWVVCGSCMGMKFVSIDKHPTIPADHEDSWWRDPQPARLGRSAI